MSLISTPWFIGGIIPALFYGFMTIPIKLTSGQISTGLFLVITGLGIITIGLLAMLLLNESSVFTTKSTILSFIYGLLWGSGTLFVFYALSHLKGSISTLAPLYNTNTLIAVLIGLIIFKEWTNLVVWKIILGAILIVLGSALII